MSEWYEIRVKGQLGPWWAAWFDGMTLTPGGDGTTILRGQVADQAALYGLIAAARDTGLSLISVNQLTRKESS